MSTNTKQRASNIELLRIVLIFMITIFHLIVHGCDIKSAGTNAYITTSKDSILLLLTSLTTVAVNCFIFISGYFGMKFKFKTLISFIVQAIFYSLFLYFTFRIFITQEDIMTIDLAKCFFPLTYNHWWFLSAYVGLYILSPLINKGCEYISKFQLGFIIILLVYLQATYLTSDNNFFSGDGLSIYSLLVVYLIARFCRMYNIEFRRPALIYFTACLFIFSYMYIHFAINVQSFAWRITTYNSPLVILGAVSLFFTFKKLKIQSNYINKISPLVFGIYLVQEGGHMQHYLSLFVKNINKDIHNSFILLLTLIAIATVIFVAGAFIEKIRQILCQPIVDYIDKLTNRWSYQISIKLRLIDSPSNTNTIQVEQEKLVEENL